MSGGRLAVFAYGSLVGRASIAATLGHETADPVPARLRGWRRRWSVARDNRACEKEFAAVGGDPFEHCLGLNLEPLEDSRSAEPNGALIEVTEAGLRRLDLRELRYRRVEVTGAVAVPAFDHVVAYVARPEHLALSPPPRSIVIASYVRAVEAAFAELGPKEVDEFWRTTGPPPVPVLEAQLVRDRIPAGNPREW